MYAYAVLDRSDFKGWRHVIDWLNDCQSRQRNKGSNNLDHDTVVVIEAGSDRSNHHYESAMQLYERLSDVPPLGPNKRLYLIVAHWQDPCMNHS